MPTTSRFECVSSSLNLGALLAKARRVLWPVLCLGVAAHLSLAQIRGIEAERRAAKPLTTQFVKRQPRLTKPLELKKRPQPKKRALERRVVSVKAKTTYDRSETGATLASGFARMLAQPKSALSRIAAPDAPTFEPAPIAAYIAGTRESENRIDMSLEMVDVDALDTGRYHAMVIQDPDDKRNIRGYFHFVQAYPVSVVAKRGQMTEFPRALPNLVDKLREWTGIRADVKRSVPFSSEEIFKVPFIYFDFGEPEYPDRLSAAEAERLGEYMMRGGLYMAEDGLPALGSTCDKAARATIEDALAAVGRPKGTQWEFEKIPHGHAIYHCYYEFPEGPPTGGDSARHPSYGVTGPFPWLEGVFKDGRLIAIMSNKAYQDVWSLRGGDFEQQQPRSFKMGINIIIFALTQEGSITHRLMASIR